jgi:hypothetical protein
MEIRILQIKQAIFLTVHSNPSARLFFVSSLCVCVQEVNLKSNTCALVKKVHQNRECTPTLLEIQSSGNLLQIAQERTVFCF